MGRADIAYVWDGPKSRTGRGRADIYRVRVRDGPIAIRAQSQSDSYGTGLFKILPY
jgi:hypothetical protein